MADSAGTASHQLYRIGPPSKLGINQPPTTYHLRSSCLDHSTSSTRRLATCSYPTRRTVTMPPNLVSSSPRFGRLYSFAFVPTSRCFLISDVEGYRSGVSLTNVAQSASRDFPLEDAHNKSSCQLIGIIYLEDQSLLASPSDHAQPSDEHITTLFSVFHACLEPKVFP